MVAKDLWSPSKPNVNIYNIYSWMALKNLQLPSRLQDGWSQKVFPHHPAVLDGREKSFPTIQIPKRIPKLMGITRVALLIYKSVCSLSRTFNCFQIWGTATGRQEVGRCRTRGKSQGMYTCQVRIRLLTLALKPEETSPEIKNKGISGPI